MKRLALKTGLFALLGIFTTVAVAWGISLWHVVHWEKVFAAGVTERDAPCWSVYRYQRPGFEWMEGQAIWSTDSFWFTKGWFAETDDPLRRVYEDRPAESKPHWVRRVVTARGWPFLALYGQIERELQPQQGWKITQIRGCLSSSSALRTKWIGPEIRVLPTTPILRGLAADVTIYAIAWWIFLVLIRASVAVLGVRGVIMRLGAALCAGFVLTIVVAWTCAATVVLDRSNPGPRTTIYPTASSGTTSIVFLRHAGAFQAECDLAQVVRPSLVGPGPWTPLPLRENYIMSGDTVTPVWMSLPRPSLLGWKAPQGVAVTDGRGWPMIAMMSTYEVHANPNGAMTRNVSWGIPLRGRFTAGLSRDAIVLPWRPVWPGFVADMLAYAAACWMLFVTPPVMRRARRSKAGLCSKCGYDLRGMDHNVCPECGAAVGKP